MEIIERATKTLGKDDYEEWQRTGVNNAITLCGSKINKRSLDLESAL